MIRDEIFNLIEKSIKILQKEKVFPKFDIPGIKIECPKERVHGDYSTNVAIVLSKKIKKDPMETAKTLASRLQVLGSGLFEKVEVKKPGFINFFLSKEYLQSQVKEILKRGEKFGQLKIGKNKKVQVEFISANPTGSLHIGNGRGAFWGDSLSNVLEKAGYRVTREYYIDDAKNSLQIRELGKTALGKGRTYLTKDLEIKIKKLKPKLKKITDFGEAGHLLAQEIQKDIKDLIENKLKIKFNVWASEEKLYKKKKIEKILSWLKKKEFVYQKEKAQWIKTLEFGDSKDWVVVRTTGEPTYFLSDIAYHKDKINGGFKKIIDIWGADHQAHVSKMKAAMKILGFKGDFDVLITQMVSLKKGKISKRKGEIITLESLVDEVGLDAVRFFYLVKSLDTQMEFDVELAKERSAKSPVFYIQYANARIHSILAKSQIPSTKFQTNSKWGPQKREGGGRVEVQISNSKLKLLTHPSELNLIKQLIRFPEIIEDTAKDYQVQRIPQYAIDLATVFHQFYRDCRVLSEDGPLTQARLGLILATKQVIKNTLNLMGISAPEKM
ncbi:arginine--tRNA ligase [Patescibacteria group bacterium]|nr:arginine--tRNA ligase [Patescibacteria group bacterium]